MPAGSLSVHSYGIILQLMPCKVLWESLVLGRTARNENNISFQYTAIFAALQEDG